MFTKMHSPPNSKIVDMHGKLSEHFISLLLTIFNAQIPPGRRPCKNKTLEATVFRFKCVKYAQSE